MPTALGLVETVTATQDASEVDLGLKAVTDQKRIDVTNNALPPVIGSPGGIERRELGRFDPCLAEG